MAKVVVGMAAKGEQKKEMSFTEKDEKEEEEEKWIMHYSSKHQILLVGEGDFSFSFALSQKFGSASNISASSLDSYGNSFISLISFSSPTCLHVVLFFFKIFFLSYDVA